MNKAHLAFDDRKMEKERKRQAEEWEAEKGAMLKMEYVYMKNTNET